MALNDFYQGTTKKFSLTITENNLIPDISSDAVIFYLKDNKADSVYVLSSSADVSSSGSTGTANFTLTDEQTDLLNPELYFYEILWEVSSSGEKYILEQSSVRVIDRI